MTLRRALFLVLLLACVIWSARISERYTVQLDVSTSGLHSLSEGARQALDQLDRGLFITAFLSELPVQRAALEQLLAPYLAHDSRPALRYVDPLKHPDQADALGARSPGELHLRWGERLEVLSQPTRATLDAALTRLALRGERWVVSLTGHGERDIDESPSGLSTFAEQARNLGYQVIALDARRMDRLPDNTAVLVVAAPQQAYADTTAAMIKSYLAEGGRVLWLGGTERTATTPDLLTQLFGLHPLPGLVVDAAAARFGLDSPANAVASLEADEVLPRASQQPAALYRATAFEMSGSADWTEISRFRSSGQSWNETGNLTGRLRRDPDAGEQPGPLTIGIALQATTGESPGRLAYLGSAYPLSNAHIGRLGNPDLAFGLLRWLSENTALQAESLPSHQVRWSPQVGAGLALLSMGVLPIAYLLGGVWLRARRRRG